MGREIRKVVPNWEHPKKDYPNHRLGRMEEGYQPLFDRDFETAMQEWLDELKEWLLGKGKSFNPDEPYGSFVMWHGGPPDKEYHRPKWKEGDRTWIQMYETVSEGTPVSPPFATREELIDYLVVHGDFWDQGRRKEGESFMECGPWKREAAEKFVGCGYAPSLMVETTSSGVTIKAPRDGI